MILIVFSLALLVTEYFFTANDHLFTQTVVMAGTIIVAGINILAYIVSFRSSRKKNPNQFVRGVMGATFLKFFLCIVAVLIYLFAVRKNIHKPDIYFLMVVYLVFTILETALLSTAVRKNPEPKS